MGEGWRSRILWGCSSAGLWSPTHLCRCKPYLLLGWCDPSDSHLGKLQHMYICYINVCCPEHFCCESWCPRKQSTAPAVDSASGQHCQLWGCSCQSLNPSCLAGAPLWMGNQPTGRLSPALGRKTSVMTKTGLRLQCWSLPAPACPQCVVPPYPQALDKRKKCCELSLFYRENRGTEGLN